MGTRNFARQNASKVFVVPGSMDDEVDSLYFEELLDLVRDRLKQRFIDFSPEEGVYKNDRYGRNFPAQHVGELRMEEFFGSEGDICFSFVVFVVARGGYYQGANLDWEVTFQSDYLEWSDRSQTDIKEHLIDYYELEEAEAGDLAETIYNWLQDESTLLVRSLEEFLGQFCPTYTSMGVASNGEEFLRIF